MEVPEAAGKKQKLGVKQRKTLHAQTLSFASAHTWLARLVLA